MRLPHPPTGVLLCLSLLGFALVGAARGAEPADEFKVKRQPTYAFTAPPAVQRQGDQFTIRFASKGFCDATVAIEDDSGRIVRHLASGVLGPNAPAPFKKDSLEQAIDWDGKDDAGKYVARLDRLSVRVSLGLQPKFEQTMFWSPHKRIGFKYPALTAGPQGVYLAEGYALDHVRLFSRDGDYLRTIYPFPADQVDKVDGLARHTFIQDGRSMPLKGGYHQATLLTCGSNRNEGDSAEGYGVNAMAVRDGRLALVHLKLNRLTAEGITPPGLTLEGPATSIDIPRNSGGWGHDETVSSPLSAALSPDGKWLYLAGYQFTARDRRQRSWLNGVARVAYDGDQPPALFVGNLTPGESNGGTGAGQFRGASSVDVDARGRVYVSDYMNDRVQVFDADGKHLKSIAVAKPARVMVHRKTGDIFVMSWLLQNRWITVDETNIQPVYHHFGPFENPAKKLTCPLPLVRHTSKTAWNSNGGIEHRVELDSWSERPRLWIVNGMSGGIHYSDDGSFRGLQEDWETTAVAIYEEADGSLQRVRSFVDDVKDNVTRAKPPILWRQRLYVNPANGRCYVAEGDCGVMKAFNQLVELDPAAPGKPPRLIDLPMGAEDMCFDQAGQLYLRTDTLVARFDPRTWREIPWDYGEEHEQHSYGMGAKGARLISGLATPGHRSFNFWHLGGIDISPAGKLIVTTCNGQGVNDRPQWQRGEAHFDYAVAGKPYTPPIYPGRQRWGEVHLFDRHGQPIARDVVPGIGHMNGIGIDRDDNIYLLSASRRLIDGKKFDPDLPRDTSGTVLKAPAGGAKVLSAGNSMVPVPLSAENRPDRPIELSGYTTGWVEGAKWFYGGVGFCVPNGCVCWNSRFDLDDFARSFCPEPLRFSVAILDANGNLITRVGRYGNVDDGKPLVSTPHDPVGRSIGGDEVALFHACYVASHTDRRLFIADAGNARVLSVKLDYEVSQAVPLK